MSTHPEAELPGIVRTSPLNPVSGWFVDNHSFVPEEESFKSRTMHTRVDVLLLFYLMAIGP